MLSSRSTLVAQMRRTSTACLLSPSHPVILPLLYDPQQLGLDAHRYFGYLVQEEGAALGQGDLALAASGPASGKGPRFVAEQFAFENGGGLWPRS